MRISRRREPRRRYGFTLIELLTVMAIIALLAAILVPRFWLARDSAAATACSQNLRNIATAVQLYGNENDRTLPASLAPLVPHYLGTIPVCQVAQRDTYSEAFEVSVNPQAFTLYCKGHFHKTAGYAPNQPYYTLDQGLGPRR